MRRSSFQRTFSQQQRTFLLVASTTLLLALPTTITSFVTKTTVGVPKQPHQHGYRNQRTLPLFGITEWRDTDFGSMIPTTEMLDSSSSILGSPREICVLPFPFDEVLLQGETKQLRLYEERFVELFDYVQEHHSGVVAMGLIAETGIIQTVPICEIEAYNRMEGFGIFVTIRAVGRAQLDAIVKQDPYIKATCRELSDKIPPNLELPNLVASNIENFMLLLSSMEHRLAQAEDEMEDPDEATAAKRRRLQIAKLDNRFYDDFSDDDEDEKEDLADSDRRARFRKSYNVALETDTQGYCVTKTAPDDRTPQELTALSWASFCTSHLVEDDASFRTQAMDCDDLFDRLKLASHMLREKKNTLGQQMKKAGLKFKGEEFDEDF